MLLRHRAGDVPAKHHIVFENPDGGIYHEECLTRRGFDGPYTIFYHEKEPHRHVGYDVSSHGWAPPRRAGTESRRPLNRRHFKTFEMEGSDAPPVDARTVMLFNRDVGVSIVKPTESDPVYFANVDGDDLYYIHRGSGVLRSVCGDLRFEEKDYVFVPKGIKHRFVLDDGVEQYWLGFECYGGLHLPKQWRNDVGQLRMDAPYCHRDFRLPEFIGPVNEGIRTVTVKRDGGFTDFQFAWSPLDVVGWDGSVYPWVFPIMNFQPRAGLVHLPPDWHGTFAIRGGIICSFVPRVVDFHEKAIPCPYPHESVDCDEVLFYAEGDFISRRGIEEGSVSLHPMGVMHGPHPGAYEASIGAKRTDELAVMMDVFETLYVTEASVAVEDEVYHDAWKP